MAGEESLAQLRSLHASFSELVQDAFGSSVLTETIEPMIQQAERLNELGAETTSEISIIDQMLTELRSIEAVD